MSMVHFIPAGQRRLVILAAQADSAPALICGASGTGKGGIAKWIHANSPRAAKPLVTASRQRSLAQQLPVAQEGTLLIPDVGEWPLSEQKTLLEFLKSRTIPLPSGEGLKMLLNVRVIATTDQVLDGRAQGGLFNAELLERLNVFRIEMPPLSKRPDEFEDIALGLTSEITRELHKEHVRGISPEALSALKGYDWPGNLRELRNVLRLASVAAQGDQLEAGDLPDFGHDRVDFRATREQFEKIYITELLKAYGYQVEKTCRVSRMDQSTLLAKIKQYGIELNP